jgi:hypothetical protein
LGNTDNYDRIRQALDELKGALAPFVEAKLVEAFGGDVRSRYAVPEWSGNEFNIDVQVLANTIVNNWDDVFSKHLKREAKHVVHQVRKTRNRFAHQETFDPSDTYTSLHEVQRLLEAIGADASSIVRSKTELVLDMAVAGESPEDLARKAEAAADDALAQATSEPGVPAKLVMLRSGLPTSVEFAFELPAVIGRADANAGAITVDLSDFEEGAYVSRRHAQIAAVGGAFVLQDLGSANGTYVKRGDYEKVDRAEIVNGDHVAFGNAKFEFRLDS